MDAPVLVVIAGLPATGKTTLARPLARELRAAYLRIDTIETAILRAQDRAELVTGGEGYAVGYDLAADQLALGLDVIAECVNPLPITRDAWRAAASRRGARIVEVELVCSDAAEHRARLQARTPDIDGLRNPSWRQVVERHYEPWGRDRLVIDTSAVGPDEAVRTIADEVRRRRGGG